MSRNVGRLTLAGALIVMGVALVADNIWQLDIAMYIGRLWPALLILLGLEWIAASKRTWGDEQMKVNPFALVALGVVAIAMAGWSSARMDSRFPMDHWYGQASVPPIEVRVPSVTVAPLPLLGGNVGAEVTSTYETPVEGLQEISVVDSSAQIEVKSGSEFKVTLKATGYGSSSADAEANARSLELRVTPGRVTRIETVRTRVLSRMGLSYEIEVPKGVSVKIRSSSGSVSVREIDGAVDATASSGNVEIREVTGDVAVTTSSGSIKLEEIGGAIRANANSGTIQIDQAVRGVTAQASSGSIEVKTDTVGGPYDLTASSGSVKLTVPESASIAVTANASSGSVSGPAWLSTGQGRHSGSGRQGGGEHTVSIRTSSGSINLDVD